MGKCELGDNEVDASLAVSIFGFDPRDHYPEWSSAAMREAYRAGFEDGVRASQSVGGQA
jgi:hypothetical protein